MKFLSRLFGRGQDSQIQAAIAKIKMIQDDEHAQNMMLNDYMLAEIAKNPECDVIPGSEGKFGYNPSNPIPVNGAIGELAYLSKLRTLNGERLFFHRIGSVGNATDMFEAVTFSGSEWFVLYLKMYFPRRSRQAPEGFALSSEPCCFTGFTQRCANFPLDFVEVKVANSGNGLNAAYAPISLVQPSWKMAPLTVPRRPRDNGQLADASPLPLPQPGAHSLARCWRWHGRLRHGGLHLTGAFSDGRYQLGPVIGEDRDRLLGARYADIE